MGAWPLWKLRLPALAYFLAVEAVAVALIVLVISSTPTPSSQSLTEFAALAVTAAAVIVGTSVSMYLTHGIKSNPWTIHMCYLAAGVMSLPPDVLVLLLLGPALHGVLDVRRQPHRWLFTTAATALAVFATRYVLGWEQPQWSAPLVISGGAALLLIRAGIVAVGWRLRDPSAPRTSILGKPVDVLLGIVAVCLGLLLGIAVETLPGSALLAGPPLAVLVYASQLPQYRRSAERDGKTGLANAAHWERLARAELAKAHTRSQHTAVLLLDLDHFKQVNDEIGHIAGDTVLAAVALTLRGGVRRGDLVGRFGGEEFVVLLPDTEPDMAYKVADRVRISTAEMSVPARDINGEQRRLDDLTVSIGLATSLRYGYELPSLLAAADSALLEAKSSGRNAIAMA